MTTEELRKLAQAATPDATLKAEHWLTEADRIDPIARARSLCEEIAGELDDGEVYGSVDVARILGGEVLRLRAEHDRMRDVIEAAKAKLGGDK